MGKFSIIFLYDYDNLDSKTITQQNDICICKWPTSSEVCGVTDVRGGPPGPDMITVPPCITSKG
jgi:hypothetical protein